MSGLKKKLEITDVHELPVGQGLETPLPPKKRRTRQPSQPATASRPTASRPSTRSTAAVSLTPPSPAKSVPSPAKFVKVRPSNSSVHRPLRPRSRQIQRNDDTTNALDHGSDAESDDDEEDLAPPFIPRVFKTGQDTPIDDEPEEAVRMRNLPADPVMTATYQPHNLYSFDWRAFPNPPISPKSRRETFSQINVGPTIPSVDPYDIFIAIWDRQFVEYIASETNRYAQQVARQLYDNQKLHPNSRINRWVDTTADELYTYFSMIIAMGIVVKSRLDEYWHSTPDIFYTPGFSAHMPINRFLLLNACLHFNNNDDMCAPELGPSEAKLFKIKPVLSHLANKFESLYIPKQNIALDESLLQWKGRLDINQFIPNKTATMGIKTYEICESQTGYLFRFEVLAYKKSPPQQLKDPLKASTPTIVLRLTKGLENKGYTLWMDNFYNSPCLARRLKALGFDCVGTLRTNRLFVPQDLHSLTKESMSPGQLTGLTSGDVDLMVWRDKNRVAMISTYHGNAVTHNPDSTKPILIMDYNSMMGGLDKKDQMLAMYPIERKQIKVWYKKFFRRLLNVSVLNSYIIHKHNSSSPLTHRNFRINLVNSLLSRHSSSTRLPLAITDPEVLSHRLAEYPLTNHQRQRRLCNVCKKRVATYCVGCKKTVCIDVCFLAMHS